MLNYWVRSRCVIAHINTLLRLKRGVIFVILCLQNYGGNTYINEYWFGSRHVLYDINILRLNGRYRYHLM